jgi:hypothetical protein
MGMLHENPDREAEEALALEIANNEAEEAAHEAAEIAANAQHEAYAAQVHAQQAADYAAAMAAQQAEELAQDMFNLALEMAPEMPCLEDEPDETTPPANLIRLTAEYDNDVSWVPAFSLESRPVPLTMHRIADWDKDPVDDIEHDRIWSLYLGIGGEMRITPCGEFAYWAPKE